MKINKKLEEEVFQNYYLDLYINHIIFSKEEVFDNKLETCTESFVLDEFLDRLLYMITSLNEENYYPEYTIANMGKLISKIKTLTDKKIISKIEEEYNELKDKESSEDKYVMESIYKFMDVASVRNNETCYNKEAIEYSIVFDYYTFTDLISDSEISINEYYIYSIKKFLLTFPEVFLDKDINRRAKEILKTNIDCEEAERLLYKMNHIKNFQETNFDYEKFSSMLDYVYFQNMIYYKDTIKKGIELLTPGKMETLYAIIEQGGVDDQEAKNNIIDIMYEYKENVINKMDDEEKKEVLKRHNEYLGMLNSITNFEYAMFDSDIINRYDKLDYIRSILHPKNPCKLIKQDIKYLNYLITDSNIQPSDELYLSVNKCISLAPCMFDDEVVYEKTMDLLKKNNYHNNFTKKLIKKIHGR